MRPALALLILAILAFAPHFDYPEWRGTEARRVQVAFEMVETGDYLTPTLWDEPTLTKPPFYYWMLAGSTGLFGVESWSMRLPSVLGFWLLSVFGFAFLRRWFDSPTAWMGAAGVLLSPVLMFDGPFAEIDPVFAAMTALSLLCLTDGVFENRRSRILLAGVLGGIAMMTKGPPYLMFFVGPIVLWWRHSRLRGIAWFLVPVVLPIAVYTAMLKATLPTGDVVNVAVQESIGRLSFWTADALEGLPQHFAWSIGVLSLPFAPWLVTWFKTTRTQKSTDAKRQNFLLWGAIGSVLLLCFSQTRSPRYMQPAVPMAIMGLAPLVAASLRTTVPVPRWACRALLILGALAGVGLVAIAWLPFPYPGTTFIGLLALGCVAFIAHSQRHLAVYSLAVPLVIAWSGFPDRVLYFTHASEFGPATAGALVRELSTRGIDQVGTYGQVDSGVLVHTREAIRSLRVEGDPEMRREPSERWILVQDRGYVKYPERRESESRVVPGYRDLVRVQLGDKKSISLREKR